MIYVLGISPFLDYGKHSIRYLGPHLRGKIDKDLRN